MLLDKDLAALTAGQALSLTIGGQTRDGKDACNEVTMLCLEADEQLSIISRKQQ